jgi:hypothetical protein
MRVAIALVDGAPLAPRSAVAALASLPAARCPVNAPSDRDLELLPREGALRESRSDQRQHPRDAAAGARLPRPRIPPPQSPQGHRDAPAPSHRMNTGSATDFGEEHIFETLNTRARAHATAATTHTMHLHPQPHRPASPGQIPQPPFGPAVDLAHRDPAAPAHVVRLRGGLPDRQRQRVGTFVEFPPRDPIAG